ncbi:MBL fold metallo-hydrolase [Massilia oculi]|uniref:MBL fold metallo-hydrolase n=1 Tax=Massilia hydrophila TaxID=3044279 RepID=A0ABS7YB06_9BURK|nr:MBL fold metallo-hydrolase [Massilia oculi]MCA1855474.1 MBL fold metallo-hydrolase [Massilia oculi]
MRIQFLGGTGTVTGSKYLLTTEHARILVDCGLFQGYKQLRLRNWAGLPFDPAGLDAVVLTHAHLDHSGYLPLLVKSGFRGKILCSEATYDLCKILLPDSGHLQEEDAAAANRHGYSEHRLAMPLYTEEDARVALRQFVTVGFDRRVEVAPGLGAVFSRAGHILGAAIVALDDGHRRITFSGDLGRANDPVMVAPAPLAPTDYLVVESTYGNRVHDTADPLLAMASVIRDTAARGGVVVIPAFAVGRAQGLMYAMYQMKASGAIPAYLPVFLDSPMARDATAIYGKHRADHRLDPAACQAMCQAATIINTVEESKQLDARNAPKVIISASGMATGGRVLHHLKAFAGDPRNTILFAGFQAGGTRGAALIDGADEIRIHGQQVRVRAQVAHVDNLSAHADSNELMGWMSALGRAPRRTFITHGEPAASEALRARIKHELGWDCLVPEHLQTVAL